VTAPGQVLDLFAGVGGWDLGATIRGVGPVVGIELDAAACRTRAAGLATAHGDVGLPAGWTGVAGLVGSPPCQPFTVARRHDPTAALTQVLLAAKRLAAGDDPSECLAVIADPRACLVLEPLRWALALRPDWVALQQVPPAVLVWQAVAEALEVHGYSTAVELVTAECHGLPQTRRRAVLVASRQHQVGLLPPTHRRYIPGHRRPDLTPGRRPYAVLADALPDRDDLPAWAYKRPATTVVGSFRPDVLAAPAYRSTVSRQNAPDSVRISVAEAGVLLGFPVSFPWQGSRSRQFQQVGNAIPPPLAAALIRAATTPVP